MEKIIHKTPNWLFEAAVCITKTYSDKELESKEEKNRFNMAEEDMTKYFSKHNEYKKAVSSEIMPIYARYPNMEQYFQPSNIDNLFTSIAAFLIFFVDDTNNLARDHKDIDKLLNKFFSSLLDDHLMSLNGSDANIEDLSTLLHYLDQVNFDDRTKLLLINLYNNPYDVLEEMAELLNQCVPICKKYYPIIEEDFKKSINSISTDKSFDSFIRDTLKINIDIPRNSEFYFSIFYYNQMTIMESYDGRIISYIGMYLEDLVELKDKNKFNDSQILADLKAIGDPTRLKIIGLLSKNKMYLQEIAEALDLAPSTISHHVQLLLNSRLISLTVDAVSSRKVYYETNKEAVEALGQSIKDLVSNKIF